VGRINPNMLSIYLKMKSLTHMLKSIYLNEKTLDLYAYKHIVEHIAFPPLVHTSSVGSKMSWPLRDRAAREMLPMTRQQWMWAAVRWCSGRFWAVDGGAGSAGSSSRGFEWCRRRSRLRVRQALPLVHPSRTHLGRASRLSRAASAWAASA
jgi:hypothetical protein